MSKFIRILLALTLTIILVLVRAFEDTLFYDPLLNFFKSDYKTAPLPDMDVYLMYGNTAFRFILNSVVSLGIISLLFKNREVIKISLFLYAILFVVLMIAFSLIIYTSDGTSSHFVLFYVRRFLIQPLFLLILLPAFYFHKYNSN
ncbi:exosortase F system-associated membrane protein [Aequorivita xiaoshiensis]|uniref:Exosortase F system-associated protein n=1 Tax=Aequorivita xiaoshiensis TaxID=2874476 RepID=A0A9X1U617_9FLAO|nr:exosortase F system-associated protein [Aequorivita xiaoshiensis]